MSEVFSYATWLIVTAAALVAGLAVVFAVRRWAQRDEKAENFTFQDLRDMRARGDITEREFAAMRDTLLSQMQVDLGPDTSSARGTPPGKSG